MYAPTIHKISREGKTLYIETQEDTYDDYAGIRGFDELPVFLDKNTADILGERLPGGFQPLPIDTIILSTKGKPGIRFNVIDVEISPFEYVDVNDVEVEVVYAITSENAQIITDGNPATRAIQDALYEMGLEQVSFRDTATNSSAPREYVMLPPDKTLYFNDIRMSYKFTVDINTNLVHLGITALQPLQFDRHLDTAYMFNSKANDDSLNAWLTVDTQFRLRANTCQRSFASALSAGTVKSMFEDVKALLVEQCILSKNLFSK